MAIDVLLYTPLTPLLLSFLFFPAVCVEGLRVVRERRPQYGAGRIPGPV